MNVSKVEQITARFARELNAKVKQKWIIECINFFEENDPLLTENELFECAKDQFLLEDISVVCESTIPDEFRVKRNRNGAIEEGPIWIMKKNLFLQMQFILDISESFYEQWRRLHNIKLDEVNENRESKTFQVKKKRCFKMELTDGKQTIHAMEIKPISCLSTKLHPGVKVVITGPVKVVNRMIMLEEKNIKIIGGEVEELLVLNAYENILLKLCNRPSTDNPITTYEENFHQIVEDVAPENNTGLPASMPIAINRPPLQQAVNDEMRNLSIDDIEDLDLDMLNEIEALEMEVIGHKTQNSQASTTNSNPVTVPAINEIDLTQEEHMVRHPKNLTNEPPINVESYASIFSKRKVPKSPPKNIPWGGVSKIESPKNQQNKQLFANLYGNKAASGSSSTKVLEQISNKSHSKATNFLTPAGSLSNNNDDNDMEMPLADNKKRKSSEILSPSRIPKSVRLSPPPKPKSCTTILDENYEYKIDYTYNFVTIDQYTKLKNIERLNKSFAIEVIIQKVYKLRLDGSRVEWVLIVEVKDEWSKNSLRLRIHDDVVAELAGYSAQELLLIRKNMLTQPQLQDDVKKILDKISDKLQSQTFIFAVTVKVLVPNNYEIVATKIVSKTDDNKHIIMLKIHDEKII